MTDECAHKFEWGFREDSEQAAYRYRCLSCGRTKAQLFDDQRDLIADLRTQVEEGRVHRNIDAAQTKLAVLKSQKDPLNCPRCSFKRSEPHIHPGDELIADLLAIIDATEAQVEAKQERIDDLLAQASDAEGLFKLEKARAQRLEEALRFACAELKRWEGKTVVEHTEAGDHYRVLTLPEELLQDVDAALAGQEEQE